MITIHRGLVKHDKYPHTHAFWMMNNPLTYCTEYLSSLTLLLLYLMMSGREFRTEDDAPARDVSRSRPWPVDVDSRTLAVSAGLAEPQCSSDVGIAAVHQGGREYWANTQDWDQIQSKYSDVISPTPSKLLCIYSYGHVTYSLQQHFYCSFLCLVCRFIKHKNNFIAWPGIIMVLTITDLWWQI